VNTGDFLERGRFEGERPAAISGSAFGGSTSVEGRQGGGREIMSATVKQRKTGVGECHLETSPQRLKLPMK
jgi:hypothetical protein